ncbi:uncharacterized protein [Typha angustifolia]|uniref:uncharacterized protein n=1 Tax=Typha angustifolia TaxID=59011 RepID=UPI003C2B52C9
MEVEDDVFFADLSKQIALLIMDEEEEYPVQCPPLPAQEGMGFPYFPQAIIPPSYTYEVAHRRESKGTGVFIPRSTLPRKKNRSSRPNSFNSKSQRLQHERSGVAAVSHVTNNTSQLYSKQASVARGGAAKAGLFY